MSHGHDRELNSAITSSEFPTITIPFGDPLFHVAAFAALDAAPEKSQA